MITGILEGPISSKWPRMIEFYAMKDIPDLRLYGFEARNNGNRNSTTPEVTFGNVSLVAGQFYLVS